MSDSTISNKFLSSIYKYVQCMHTTFAAKEAYRYAIYKFPSHSAGKDVSWLTKHLEKSLCSS